MSLAARAEAAACRCSQQYGCNVLNLGSSRIISCNASSARQIVQDPHFKGDVQVIDFSPITSMYGAVHCSSQARPRKTPGFKLGVQKLAKAARRGALLPNVHRYAKVGARTSLNKPL